MATQTTTIRVVADTSQAERALGGLTNTLKSLATIGAISAIAKQFVTLADESTNLQNKMRLVMQEGQTTGQMFNLMAKTAINLGVPLSDVGDLFFRIANNTKDLSLSQVDQLRITELMLKAFQSTGLAMNEAKSAVVQFGQGLSAGVLRGEELNSVLENAPPIADAIAAHFGVTRGALKMLGEQGKITSKDVVDAMKAAGDSIDRDFAQRIPTVQNSLNVLGTVVKTLTTRFDEQNGVSAAFSYAMLIVADAIISVYEWFQKWGKVIMWVVEAIVMIYAPLRIARIAFTTLIAPIEWLIGLFSSGGGIVRAFGGIMAWLESKVAPLTGPVTLLGDGIAKFFAGIAAGASAIGLGSLISGIKDLFGNDKKTMAENYSAKLADINKRLGIDNVEASNKAKAASDALTAQQISDAKKWSDALRDRGESLKEIIKAQQDSIGLTKYEGTELKIQEQINAANKQLIKAVKNDKGDIIGYTKGLTVAEEANLRLLALQNIQLTLQRDTQSELTKANQQFLLVKTGMYDLTSQQLDIELKILDAELQYGKALDDDVKNKMRSTQETLKQIEYMKTIKSEIEKLNALPVGDQAAAAAAGQLGGLLPEKKILADRDTLMNGLQALRQRDQISEQDYQTARMNAEFEANAAILADRQKFAEAQMKGQGVTNTAIIDMVKQQMAAVQMMQQGGIVGVQGVFQSLTTALGTMSGTSKKAFEMHKKMAIAQALISTYQAASMAIAFPPGPPLSLIYVGGAILAGMAQVAMIKQQQFSGRALGGPVMGGTPYLVGENGPEIFTPTTTGAITRNQDIGGGGNVNVNFTINAVDGAGLDAVIMQRRGLITQIITDAVAERGRRVM